MSVKFSEDVVPLTDLKVNPGRVVRQAAEAHRPVLERLKSQGFDGVELPLFQLVPEHYQ